MTPLVYINGYLLSPTDYSVIKGHVVFPQAPPAGDIVDIRNDHGASFISIANGVTVVYKVYEPEDQQWADLLEKLTKHRRNPTIQDQLEMLAELLELVD